MHVNCTLMVFPKEVSSFETSTNKHACLLWEEESGIYTEEPCLEFSSRWETVLKRYPNPSSLTRLHTRAKLVLLLELLNAVVMISFWRIFKISFECFFSFANSFLRLFFSLPLSSAIDGFLKTDERQRLAKERREEREKYLGKLAGGVCIICIHILIGLTTVRSIFSVLNVKSCHSVCF